MTADIDGTVSWGALLEETVARLRSLDDATNTALEATWIVEEASGSDPGELRYRLHDPATVRGVAALDRMVDRRLAGEPIQYVLGHWAFRSLDLLVDHRVLIPRPETEQLVDAALERVPADPQEPPVVVDLGCGSGAIGLGIAIERPDALVHLTDRSAAAIEVARANLAGLGVRGARVSVHVGDWFEALPPALEGLCDVIVSNPPYVAVGDDLPSSVVEWEPAEALFAGEDGLDDIRRIVADCARWLRPGGTVLVELDPKQAASVAELLGDGGFTTSIGVDLSGRQRWVVGEAP